MDSSHKHKPDFNPFLSEWIKSAAQIWESAAKLDPSQKGASPAAKATRGGQKGHSRESWDVSFKVWQALSSAMGDPTFWGALLRGTNTMPEMFIKIANSGWESFLQLQKKWLEKAAPAGEKSQAYSFDQIDKDLFKIWSEVYESELRQYFNVPQLGLLRFHQEKLNQATDHFNRMATDVGAFMHLFALPIEKSLTVMQTQLSQMADEGKLPENPKDYYNMWIKILEGHYMTLFKSPDYVQALGKTIETLSEFMAVRQEVIEDLLQTVPVPTQSEVDELYKEIYGLKKRIVKMERRQRTS